MENGVFDFILMDLLVVVKIVHVCQTIDELCENEMVIYLRTYTFGEVSHRGVEQHFFFRQSYDFFQCCDL